MANKIEVGTKYNRLTFVGLRKTRSKDNHLVGIWKCDCGNTKEVMIVRAISGKIKSCGCLLRDNMPGLKHGQKYTRTYSSWQAMKRRCEIPEDKDFWRYGALGIRVCKEWLDFSSFYRDMGDRPKGTTIDRIDGTKGYEKGNCRWATPSTQARNTKWFVVIKTPLGIMPLCDYAKHLGISRGAAGLRLKRGKLEGCDKYEPA